MEEEIGTPIFIKLAGKYLYERNKFKDGVIYINKIINEDKINLINKICFLINMDNLKIENEENKLEVEDFYKGIRKMNILILFNITGLKKENLKGFKEFLEELIEKTNIKDINEGVKVLIARDYILGLNNGIEKIFPLSRLSDDNSANLLLSILKIT